MLAVENKVGSTLVMVFASAMIVHHLAEQLPVLAAVAQVSHCRLIPDALGCSLRCQLAAQPFNKLLPGLDLYNGFYVRTVLGTW